MFTCTLEPLPTLLETFGTDTVIMKAVQRGGFTSVLPFMLLPFGSIQDLHGIGSSADTRVTALLKRQGLERRPYIEPLMKYLVRKYGCVEDAPIGVLNTDVVRKDAINYPTYAPLQSIRLLEATQPYMAIIDLIKYSRVELRALLKKKDPDKTSIKSITDDVSSIEARLAGLQLGLTRTRETVLSVIV